MEITIRPCSPEDAEALSLVAQATFLQTYADELPLEDMLEYCRTRNGVDLHRDWLARPDHRFWIAELASTRTPVGFSMLAPPDLGIDTEPGDVELRRIYLLHRFHGGGTGARLLNVALRSARDAGHARLLLSVFTKNPSAIAFYARQGFTQAGVRKFRVGSNDYDDLVLARRLD